MEQKNDTQGTPTKKLKVDHSGTYQSFFPVQKVAVLSPIDLELEETPRRYLGTSDFTSNLVPLISPAPLVHPSNAMRVPLNVKEAILAGPEQRSLRAGSGGAGLPPTKALDVLMEDVDEKMPHVILFHGDDKSEVCYAEILNMLRAESAIFSQWAWEIASKGRCARRSVVLEFT